VGQGSTSVLSQAQSNARRKKKNKQHKKKQKITKTNQPQELSSVIIGGFVERGGLNETGEEKQTLYQGRKKGWSAW